MKANPPLEPKVAVVKPVDQPEEQVPIHPPNLPDIPSNQLDQLPNNPPHQPNRQANPLNQQPNHSADLPYHPPNLSKNLIHLTLLLIHPTQCSHKILIPKCHN